MLKSDILIGQKSSFSYTEQGNYYIIETKLLFLTALFYKTLTKKTVASLYQNKTCQNLSKIMQIRVSNYYNEKTRDFK